MLSNLFGSFDFKLLLLALLALLFAGCASNVSVRYRGDEATEAGEKRTVAWSWEGTWYPEETREAIKRGVENTVNDATDIVNLLSNNFVGVSVLPVTGLIDLFAKTSESG